MVGTLPGPQEVDSMVATALAEAAGVMGRRQWALILSSSARVSQITYKTVFAVRYPELDSKGTDEVHFGTYLADQQATVGVFLPMFWKAHFSPVHASPQSHGGLDHRSLFHLVSESAGENGCLAVLHNRNDMVNAFNRSEWVASSASRIVSRGATSCAGMTARHVLLARNKIGFLTGGRSSKLEDKEQEAQKEEAFARARVALTCAQRFCFSDVSP